ncbi:hypothetical protein Calag_1062 [Caldisphaera lagunensis DSM 15908]|uniref:Uncharacterized protein n=1 Tax=Caldisphaera lagunensis (strain DSM 15908 / JCM 11604 / ANMR 0165 / IC-154) TaxID=1056495 RepID=L0ABI5_CALLD|nr:hypothetical protein [Caldisphaera lagunensis]AFZ70784.1 hypothetical protein Calag_1062 [Caldisphaera lagunensis DSM 15908]
MEKVSEILNSNLEWSDVERFLYYRPYHYHVLIKKTNIGHPKESGYKRSYGEYNGEKYDWRKTLIDGSCAHVREYDTYYIVHRDRVNPDDNLIKHIALDSLKSLPKILPFIIPILLLRYNYKLVKKKRLRRSIK